MTYRQNGLTKSNTSLSIVADKALPALSGSSLTYNAEKNIFLTQGYTSAAGNTYYRALRVSDRLVIYYDLGQGYCYTFLNGITLYAWNGREAKIIAKKTWGGCDWRCFNEAFAKEESIKMLKNYLASEAKIMGQYIPDNQLQEFSRRMVEEVHQKRIANR